MEKVLKKKMDQIAILMRMAKMAPRQGRRNGNWQMVLLARYSSEGRMRKRKTMISRGKKRSELRG